VIILQGKDRLLSNIHKILREDQYISELCKSFGIEIDTIELALQDIYNQPALSLSVEMDRDVSLIGKKGITYMLYSLIAVGSIFTIAVMLFLEKNILSRLLKLSKEVLNIGNSGEFSKRLYAQKKQDEIFILSEGINNMLDR